MKKQNTQNGFSVVELCLIVVVVGIVGLLGWKFYEASTNNSQKGNVSNQSELADLQVSDLEELANLKAIQGDAVLGRDGVSVVQVELEQSGGRLVYQTHLSDGSVLTYDAKTGAKLKTETESKTTAEKLPANFSSGIGFAKALEIAKAKNPSSKVSKIELEIEDGLVVYSVRFTDKARVDVNAENGTVMRTKAAETEDKKNQTKQRSNTDDRDDEDDAEDDSASRKRSGSSSATTSNDASDDDNKSGSSSHRSGGDDDDDEDESKSVEDNDDSGSGKDS